MVLIKEDEIDSDGIVCLDGRRAKHIHSILKATPGKKVRVGIINGARGSGIITESEPEHVAMETEFISSPPPEPAIDILLALPRPLVMKRLWSILPSLGIGRIILTNASKVERYYFDTHWLEEENYLPLIQEGLEQAGDTRMPEIHIYKQFKVMVHDGLPELFGGERRILAHPGGGCGLGDLAFNEGERALLAIGPEGGWTDYEIERLTESGFECASMGWRILRTETACAAAIGILCSKMKSLSDEEI